MKKSLTHSLTLLLVLLATAAGGVQIDVLDTDAAGFVGVSEHGPLDVPTLVTSYAEFVAVFGDETVGLDNPHLAPSAAGFFINGGTRLWVVRTVSDSFLDLDAGLRALLAVDEIAMIAVPGVTEPAVQATMIAHCEAAGDRMAILDPASLDDPQAVQVQRAGLVSPDGHAALYFPWIEAAPAGESLVLPPSGFVAGLYASADPSDSPIGVVVTATGLSYNLTDAENDILNPLGINAIRDFGVNGIRVWGARTVSSDPEWRYVAVRRTGLCIEESIHDGTAWAVFEPNDEPLWAQLRTDVNDFLFGRWADGWLQGDTPDDAYFVRCDQTTMTEADIDAGRTVIVVGIAPVSPAEFIVLRIVHQRSVIGVEDRLEAPEPVRIAAVPNPFNPRTVIDFSLPRNGAVHLRIHDLAGRLVRELIGGEVLAVGRHSRTWDGRDHAGAGVPSGVYLVRMETADQSVSRSVTLVR